MYPKCRGHRVPKKCYFKANQFAIKLLGREQLEKTMRVKRIIPHKRFHYHSLTNDIALLELEEPLKCTGMTSPICLPTKRKMYENGQTFKVAGWGWNTPEGLVGPQLLREGVMKEIEAKECMMPGFPDEKIDQIQCAVGTNQMAYKGDSGTSSFIKYKGKFYALGVTSHGEEFCNFKPSTFTQVLYFSDWIKNYVKDLPEP
ncbi:tryptase beta-2 [Trichonephila inaurata madagascariensis]|uniref:Tryptase beta-2 n=1 Tax=Trichonephila inaurata madagascariensis TaxID=2747483 RepID=A0A8X7C7D7_9ARAC|nr:tryptase beta-2 [Trichonephila inaurata madagascariensis]